MARPRKIASASELIGLLQSCAGLGNTFGLIAAITPTRSVSEGPGCLLSLQVKRVCPVCHPVLNHARKTEFFVVRDDSRPASPVSLPFDR